MMTGVTFSSVMRLRDGSWELQSDSGPYLVAARSRMRDRAVARLRQGQLDRALAAGAAPESAAALSVRARRLTALPNRRAIAQAYRRVVREACAEGRRSRVRILTCKSRVMAASDELSGLADRLARPGPVAAQGAAQALILLTDGTGPLYNPKSDLSLRACAACANENLALPSG
jgi:hypothetical protein